MKIDRKLNLVLTIDQDGGTVAHVHSTPIGAGVFDRYFLTITKTYAAMLENGGEWMLRSGPRVAARMLRRVAEADGSWSGSEGVERGLLAEIRRRGSVALCGEQGWEQVPLQEAIDRKLFDEEDLSEVENAVVFFTVCCASMRRAEADGMLSAIFGLFGAQLTSSNASEFLSSLPTSMPEGPTGEKVTASSIPR